MDPLLSDLDAALSEVPGLELRLSCKAGVFKASVFDVKGELLAASYSSQAVLASLTAMATARVLRQAMG